LNQVGFPLLSVTQECTTDVSAPPPLLHVSQVRFRPVGSLVSADQFWQVPVCAVWQDRAGGNYRQCMLLTKVSDIFTLKSEKSCPVWLSADADAAGYYAVSYEPSMADRLTRDGLSRLTAAERAATLRNIQLMFSSGLGNLEQDLEFTNSYSQSVDPGIVR